MIAMEKDVVFVCRHEKRSKPSADMFLGHLKFPQIESYKFAAIMHGLLHLLGLNVHSNDHIV